MTRLRLFLCGLALALLVSGGGAWAAESRFFTALGDVPVMPGLYELAKETVIFDTPEGRIVESAAVGENVQPAEIMAFYAEILPQLGWAAADAGAYTRQGERLALRLDSRDGLNIVRFSLSPAP